MRNIEAGVFIIDFVLIADCASGSFFVAGRAELSFSAACSSGFCLAEEHSSVASISDSSSVALFASDFPSERASSCFSSPEFLGFSFRAGTRVGFVLILVWLFLFRLFLRALLRLYLSVRVVCGFGFFV
jgi:hypothetical protein